MRHAGVDVAEFDDVAYVFLAAIENLGLHGHPLQVLADRGAFGAR
jgi:hypothetical protein